MKKITKFMKENTKPIICFMAGVAISGGSVYAATILMNADQVGFDKTGTSLSSTDVQGALDELYERTKSLDDIPTMQGFQKSSLSIGNTAVLRDSRDGNIYNVAKLADGNVWMTENLRIANITITSADSNVSSNFTIPASSTSGFSFSVQDTNNAYVDSTYGGYYTFYTATAGTGGTSLTSGYAPSDICPKGWELPTDGEFQTLYDNYNSSALMQGTPGFVLSGAIGGGSVYDQGSEGNYWSSYSMYAENALYLSLNSSDADLSIITKSVGFSVRCVAK